MSTDTFRDFTLELLGTLGNLRCKRLFGGYYLYSGECFMASISMVGYILKHTPRHCRNTWSITPPFLRLLKISFAELPRSSRRYSGR